MNQHRHTPGPWIASYESRLLWAITYHTDGVCADGVDAIGDRPISQTPANARLIAAAPELLELLAGLLATAKVVDAANKGNAIERCCGFSPELFAKCDAMIAKAVSHH